MKHTFRDGIEREAHRHTNGGGWVANAAVVLDDAFVGPFVEVIGGTIRGGTIWGGTIRGGTIEGGTIRGGTIEGGTIEGGTITRNVTFLTGCFPHSVTITDDHVGVGCEWHPPEHWRDHGVNIMCANGQSEMDAERWMNLLITFIDLHGCVGAPS